LALSQLAVRNRRVLTLSAWAGLVCLLLVAADGIPDTEQFTGAFVDGVPLTIGTELSADSRLRHTVAVSRAVPSAYLALLFRSPPASHDRDDM